MKSPSAKHSVAILRDCLQALGRACAGPVEQGGLLFGTRSGAGTLLYDAHPLPGALRAPRSFLPARWRPPRDLRRDVVGWFHSHPDRDPFLSRADARVHRHLFPDGDGLALVVGATPPRLNLALYGGSPPRAMEALRLL